MVMDFLNLGDGSRSSARRSQDKLADCLKQSQFDELERHLYEVSDSSHHRSGQHLTSAEVDELVKPSDDALELVHDWLLDNGIERHRLEYNSAKNWIKVTLPVQAVEGLLDTTYSVYKHEEGDYTVRPSN
ncbi:MAG: tripeptidyl peptidase [Lasallia pustulata]|uniref:Tripeptidyl peptidase n=1 Tax=Lasallia pustulata TaxID=136370 RepID=A0A5M8PH84_9LECA|nr:MAG: tripeptidyl peptidase [Lasallia pustulata]